MQESKEQVEGAVIAVGRDLGMEDAAVRVLLQNVGLHSTIKEVVYRAFVNDRINDYENRHFVYECYDLIKKYCKEMEEKGEVGFGEYEYPDIIGKKVYKEGNPENIGEVIERSDLGFNHYVVKWHLTKEMTREYGSDLKVVTDINIEDYRYSDPSETLKNAVRILNIRKESIIERLAKGWYPKFDYPNYWNLPKNIYNQLSADEVGFIQGQVQCWMQIADKRKRIKYGPRRTHR